MFNFEGRRPSFRCQASLKKLDRLFQLLQRIDRTDPTCAREVVNKKRDGVRMCATLFVDRGRAASIAYDDSGRKKRRRRREGGKLILRITGAHSISTQHLVRVRCGRKKVSCVQKQLHPSVRMPQVRDVYSVFLYSRILLTGCSTSSSYNHLPVEQCIPIVHLMRCTMVSSLENEGSSSFSLSLCRLDDTQFLEKDPSLIVSALSSWIGRATRSKKEGRSTAASKHLICQRSSNSTIGQG